MQEGPPSPPPLPTGLPYSLVMLKQELTVTLLNERSLVNLIKDQRRFTQRQAVIISGYSLSTIKRAIANKELKVARNGSIAREDLIDWLKKDPIEELTKSISRNEKNLLLIASEIEALMTGRD